MRIKILTLIFVGIALINFIPQAAAANKTATVTLTNFDFTPKTIRIKKGETVVWKSKEGSHTVKADNGSFDSGTITNGQSFSYKFEKAGTYRYFCSFHGSSGGHDMAGTVIVK